MWDISIIQIFMRDFSIIKQKILQYLDIKGISKYKFYQETGITNGILSQTNGLSEENTLKFLSKYRDISLDWLFYDEGSMLRSDAPSDSQTNSSDTVSDGVATVLQKIIHDQALEIAMLKIELNKYRPSSAVGDQP